MLKKITKIVPGLRPTFNTFKEIIAVKYDSSSILHLITLKSYFRAIVTLLPTSVTRKKLPNVYKSCPKLISLEKWKILTPLQKLQKNVGDLGKLIVAKGFNNLLIIQ